MDALMKRESEMGIVHNADKEHIIRASKIPNSTGQTARNNFAQNNLSTILIITAVLLIIIIIFTLVLYSQVSQLRTENAEYLERLSKLERKPASAGFSDNAPAPAAQVQASAPVPEKVVPKQVAPQPVSVPVPQPAPQPAPQPSKKIQPKSGSNEPVTQPKQGPNEVRAISLEATVTEELMSEMVPTPSILSQTEIESSDALVQSS
jgi:hypothetical protein